MAKNPKSDELNEIERLHRDLRFVLQEELAAWGKKQFWMIFLVIAVVGVFGFKFTADNVISGMVKERVELSVAAEVEKFENLKAAASDALKAAHEAAAQATIEFNLAKKRVEATVKAAEQAENAAAEATLSAVTAARTANEKLGASGEPPDEAGVADELTPDEMAAINIRQIARKTTEKVSGRTDGKTYTELTYSVIYNEKDNEMNAVPASVLSHISKVEYVFNERWFNPPVRTRYSNTDQFLYRIKVWGSTVVTARIHLVNPTKVLLRNRSMVLKPPAEGVVFNRQ